MPAEWNRHVATWLTWPRPDGISFPDRYEDVPPVYAAFIRQLIQGEEVHINVWHEEMEQQVRSHLARHGVPLQDGRIHFHYFRAYEPWCRDHGPIFLKQTQPGASASQRAIVDWRYNAWGGKYPPFDLDDEIPVQVAAWRNLPLHSPNMILEGGAIDVNGLGTLLTTEACLLNPNRNPNLNRQQIERFLQDFLGVSHILWLGDGIVGDDTDGHVDDLARFINPTTVATIVERDRSDENFPILQENLKRLQQMKDQDGNPLRIVELPTPGFIEYDGQRLPASYANFYIANSAVIVPTFRHRNDNLAIEILQREFADRPVVGIDSTDLIWGLGSFHCISQQEPA